MTDFWKQDCLVPHYTRLTGTHTTDTVVIGGGICGILTAFLLQRQGIDCIVLEAASIGSGQTMGTTAKITAQHGLCYHSLIQSHGRGTAKAYAKAQQRAIDDYKSLILEEKISCGFRRCPAYLYSTQENTLFLMAEANDAAYLGFDASYTQDTPLPFAVTGAVCFENQACFHPLHFLYTLSQKLTVFEHSRVLRVEPPDRNRKSTGHPQSRVYTEQGEIMADRVIFACHYPFIRYPGSYFLKMYQKQNPVLALKNVPLPDAVCLGVDPDGLSFRSTGQYLLLGGCSYRTGDSLLAQSSLKSLKEKAQLLYPEGEIAASWTAQDCVTADALPYIGTFSPNRPDWYIADGFGKWGMTNSMIAACLLRDLFTRQENALSQPLSPQRLFRHMSLDFFLEHTGVSTRSLLLSRFKKPYITAEELKPDEGGLVLYHGKKTAAYRDPDGHLYTLSPYCPHMRCELSWNDVSHTWDCPCHGSRFRYDGTLLCGPANQPITLPDEPEHT